jgi:biopolymer transport protein ExbB
MFYSVNKTGRGVIIAVAVLIVFFIGSVGFNYIYAQAEGKSTGVQELGIMGLIKAGGWVGHFIILCSIVGMGFVIEHIVNIKKDKLCPPEIVAELEALVEEGRYEEAVTLCSANPNFFCNIMGSALSKVNEGYDAMVEALGTAGEEEAAKLNMKISYISLIGNIAPMLGLTGTVVGMIASFGVIKTKLSPSPADLASGVEAALVTTVEGLLVSMPLMTAFFMFKNKVTLYIIEIGIMAGEFVDKFKGMTAEQQ